MWVIVLTLCKAVLRGASHTQHLCSQGGALPRWRPSGSSSTNCKPNKNQRDGREISGRERWQRLQHSCHMIQGQWLKFSPPHVFRLASRGAMFPGESSNNQQSRVSADPQHKSLFTSSSADAFICVLPRLMRRHKAGVSVAHQAVDMLM